MPETYHSNSLDDFNKISVDDNLNGLQVSSIILQSTDYIVFRSNGLLRYNAKNLAQSTIAKISELTALEANSFEKFKHTKSRVTDSHTVSILSEIFGCDCTDDETIKKIDNKLEAFRDFINKEPAPSLIIDSNKDFTVYLDNKNIAQYELKDKSLEKSSALDDFYKTRAWGMAVLPDSKFRILNIKLGTCLTIGFKATLTNEKNINSTVFTTAISFIEKSITDRAKFYLILHSLILSLIFIAASAITYSKFQSTTAPMLNLLLIGVLGGVCGAQISVLQRSKDLQVGLYESTRMIVLQGLVRVGLGCAFGVISLIACKAGLFLDLMKESNSRLFILAIVAGFSERLIPDFIEKTGKEKG
ncbi:hypothetical protein [Pseudomonas sp. VE 196-7]|uniref:hypothetical protein n=1 Tax=unclassified Pseudomonas TaxID=196821 RepID=UPI000D1FDFFC|nr:hypothetical protein [Pseudomonas sp. VE 196-7]AVX89830.1 hypothetical protein PkP19E3_16525 [Pseudomonas koreensis]MCU7217918.1 NFACT family protein [Pseudomonas sp. VE 196-7]